MFRFKSLVFSIIIEKSYSLLIFKLALLQICAVNSICLWTCHSFCVPLFQLAGAKVQLFFNLASFFEKIFWLFFPDHSTTIFKNLYAPILSFRVGKDTTFTFYYPNLFSTFFKVFLICLIFQFVCELLL